MGNPLKLLTAAMLVLLVAAIFIYFGFAKENIIAGSPTQYDLLQCKNDSINATVDCWYELMRKEMHRNGIQDAFVIFKTLYENFDSFIETGCHRHAHRLGDAAYYELYLSHNDIEKMEFPQETKYCGYGFYHGFLEHLINDNPDPKFADKTCRYLDRRLGDTMPYIRGTCYHASGHGFMLEPLNKIQWGDAYALIIPALEKCEVTISTPTEKEECKTGAFNVLLDWMFVGEYGLSYNTDDPFWICRKISQRYHYACYYEMAQELSWASKRNIEKAAQVADAIEDTLIAKMVMTVTVAGMMQEGIAYNREYDYLLSCRNTPRRLTKACISGIAAGFVEHGNPEKEYEKGLQFCNSDQLHPKEKETCYHTLFFHLQRFYTQPALAEWCNMIPRLYQSSCL